MSGCTGTTKKGAPCKARPLKNTTLCLAHSDEKTRESTGFGIGGGRPPKPRAVDLLRERIEKDIDRYLAPIEEALEATSGVVVGNGRDAHVEVLPDYGTRLKAAAMALDRVYGRPRQAMEVTGADGGPVASSLVLDPKLAEEGLDLLARAARASAK
jgi:hypothetical protein